MSNLRRRLKKAEEMLNFDKTQIMNVGVVGLQEPRISVTLYTSKTYLLSAAQTPTQRSDRS